MLKLKDLVGERMNLMEKTFMDFDADGDDQITTQEVKLNVCVSIMSMYGDIRSIMDGSYMYYNYCPRRSYMYYNYCPRSGWRKNDQRALRELPTEPQPAAAAAAAAKPNSDASLDPYHQQVISYLLSVQPEMRPDELISDIKDANPWRKKRIASTIEVCNIYNII
jgi:hypothetical protein